MIFDYFKPSTDPNKINNNLRLLMLLGFVASAILLMIGLTGGWGLLALPFLAASPPVMALITVFSPIAISAVLSIVALVTKGITNFCEHLSNSPQPQQNVTSTPQAPHGAHSGNQDPLAAAVEVRQDAPVQPIVLQSHSFAAQMTAGQQPQQQTSTPNLQAPHGLGQKFNQTTKSEVNVASAASDFCFNHSGVGIFPQITTTAPLSPAEATSHSETKVTPSALDAFNKNVYESAYSDHEEHEASRTFVPRGRWSAE